MNTEQVVSIIKKAYAKPELKVYGDLRSVTQGIDRGNNSRWDNGNGAGTDMGMNRTS